MVNWHNLEIKESTNQLQSTTDGLSANEAKQRLETDGPNLLVEKGIKNPLAIIAGQLASLMVLILLAAGGLSIVLGKMLEAGSIFGIVALFVTLGFLQEYRAEKAIAALKKLSVPLVRVRRDGQIRDIPSRDLVRGDLVLLEAGSQVPADLRLVEAANLRIQESALTGESESVEKQTDPLPAAEIALGDRTNLAYMGTSVSQGRGVGLVVKTGMDTELGKIAGMLQEVKQSQTPLQRKLNRVGLVLAVAGVSVAGLIMLIGLLAGGNLADMLLTAVSVAVAVVPEGLPAILTFTLAMGAQRMLKRNALIRKLPAVETLGSVSVICSDKTGTLTENRMTVVAIDIAGQRIPVEAGKDLIWQPTLALVLAGSALCNDAELQTGPDGQRRAMGDPTEGALLLAAARLGLEKTQLEALLPRVAELPFDSGRKRMSTMHHPKLGKDTEHTKLQALLQAIGVQSNSPGIVFTKGSVDGLLPRANRYWDGQAIVAMDAATRGRISAACEELAGQGMRVLGLAFRPLSSEIPVEQLEDDLVFAGMAAIIDPPRPEVKAAVETCRLAGIRPIMITGDHPLTAAHIAGELGISSSGQVRTGLELSAMDDAQLAQAVNGVSVFARVSPEHKLRIVSCLQAGGQVVAMTGDGVNDAPALKRADIGVAMGITGTDVSKEAAAMVLRDDNFSTIVSAVEEGRSIYDNIKSYIGFSVAGNLAKVAFMLAWPLLFVLTGMPLLEAAALLPLQLLWLNLLTDGLLGLAIGLEPVHKGAMRRPPISRASGIFADGMGAQVVRIGLIECVIALTIAAWYHFQGLAQWQAMAVLCLSFLQVAQAISLRNPHISLIKGGLLANRTLNLLALAVIALQVLVLMVPVLSQALGMNNITPIDFGLALASGMVLLLILEIEKMIVGAIQSRRDRAKNLA